MMSCRFRNCWICITVSWDFRTLRSTSGPFNRLSLFTKCRKTVKLSRTSLKLRVKTRSSRYLQTTDIIGEVLISSITK